MPSTGLMIAGGIGQGLLQGVNSYNDARKIAMEEARARAAEKYQNAGLLLQANKEGFSFDPDSGLLAETDVGKSGRDLDRRFKESQIAENLAQARAAGKKNNDLTRLPVEDQKVVEGLATKNAAKIAISNQIDAVMGNWDKLPDDQKIAQGRQLIKVLNSTEGADAVGKDEAARLGSKLEIGLTNVMNRGLLDSATGGLQTAGRDLEGFKTQANETGQGIKRAIYANDKEIANRYGRGGIKRDAKPPTGLLIDAGENEVERRTKDGKIAVFDANTKQFLRYK